ncbi:hypothetical protein RJ639_004157 [Escallonia herrerae]|uniref:Retrotransposon gag domain-containing protein n=1 Tax=Escallonia herrerae TaxID=1293975 RepID=A0AA89AZA9_9ASTE|nr:hypothetical protein RJ639_004157 [Escallonia herrerae]
MPELRLYNGAREARQVDNFFWCLKRYFEALDIDDEEEQVQQTIASQVELIFNILDDLEVDSRLTVLGWKVDVFEEELDDLIEERVAHFMKWEVQQRKDLKGQVTELQKELAACKKELTRATRQGCIARYFEALDIYDEEEKVQKTVRYLTVKTWEKFKRELQRQFYPKSIKDMAMINLRWLRQKGSIREYVKEYSILMLEISEMSERQRLCFFVDRLQYWVATELQRREPHDLASAIAIIERLGDFKRDDERNGEEGRRRHHKEEKKHGESHKRGDSHDHKAHGGLRRECFYYASQHYGKDYMHKGKITAFLEKHKSSRGDSSSSDEEAHMGALQMVNAFVHKSKEEAAKRKKSKKRWGLLYPKVDVAEKTQEALVDTGATHNFMSPRVTEWLGLKPTKDGSWFTAVNNEERHMKGVIKNVNLRTGRWTWKADFNIIDMDELGGKEGQPEWMIPLVSKDGADTRKGITVLQLDIGSMICYGERKMGPRTSAVDMLTKAATVEKFKHCLSLIHLLSC